MKMKSLIIAQKIDGEIEIMKRIKMIFMQINERTMILSFQEIEEESNPILENDCVYNFNNLFI
jgi:hypothetical protein